MLRITTGRGFFCKRAQIFAADLYGAFHYAPILSQTLDHHAILVLGSPKEADIRANTIWVVELIRQEMACQRGSIKAIDIDWVLLNPGQDETFKRRPYHRTVTIFY